MGIKIKTGPDGRVDPELMRLLRDFAEHRDLCSQCGNAFKNQIVNGYCATGMSLCKEMSDHPDVGPMGESDNRA